MSMGGDGWVLGRMAGRDGMEDEMGWDGTRSVGLWVMGKGVGKGRRMAWESGRMIPWSWGLDASSEVGLGALDDDTMGKNRYLDKIVIN
jgi:hypothetical protein